MAIEALSAAGAKGISVDFTLPDLVDTLAAKALPLAPGSLSRPPAGGLARGALHEVFAEGMVDDVISALSQGVNVRVLGAMATYALIAADLRLAALAALGVMHAEPGRVAAAERGSPDDATAANIEADEIAYLCEQVSRYFHKPVVPTDVVWSYAGVRPLLDDGSGDAASVTRDYALELDVAGAPVLSVSGFALAAAAVASPDSSAAPLVPTPAPTATPSRSRTSSRRLLRCGPTRWDSKATAGSFSLRRGPRTAPRGCGAVFPRCS